MNNRTVARGAGLIRDAESMWSMLSISGETSIEFRICEGPAYALLLFVFDGHCQDNKAHKKNSSLYI